MDDRAEVAGKAADQLDGAVFDLGLAAAQTLSVETGKRRNERAEGVVENGFDVEVLRAEFV